MRAYLGLLFQPLFLIADIDDFVHHPVENLGQLPHLGVLIVDFIDRAVVRHLNQ